MANNHFAHRNYYWDSTLLAQCLYNVQFCVFSFKPMWLFLSGTGCTLSNKRILVVIVEHSSTVPDMPFRCVSLWGYIWQNSKYIGVRWEALWSSFHEQFRSFEKNNAVPLVPFPALDSGRSRILCKFSVVKFHPPNNQGRLLALLFQRRGRWHDQGHT